MDLKIAGDVKWERKRQCGKSQRALATARGDAVSSDSSIFVSNGHQISEHIFWKCAQTSSNLLFHSLFLPVSIAPECFFCSFSFMFCLLFSYRSGSLIIPYFMKRFLVLLLAIRPIVCVHWTCAASVRAAELSVITDVPSLLSVENPCSNIPANDNTVMSMTSLYVI